MPDQQIDYIQLRNIRLPLPIQIKPDSWHRTDKAQPAVISVRASYPSSLINRSSGADDVNFTLNYGTLYRTIESSFDPKKLKNSGMNVLQVATLIADTTQDVISDTLTVLEDAGAYSKEDEWSANGLEEVEVSLHLPKAILRASGGLHCKLNSKGSGVEEKWNVEFRIEGIKCFAIIGVNPHEREENQALELAMTFSYEPTSRGCLKFLQSYQELAKDVAEFVDGTSFKTVEALATSVAKIAITDYRLERVTVNVEKPSAMAFVEFSGIEITRSAGSFQQ